MADNIQVMVRVRPLNDREKREGAKSCIILDDDAPNSITIDAKPENKSFKFDFVGGDRTTQEDIFQIAAKPLMMASLEGYNACIFAYGQTGAGKTFTMQGRGLEEDRDSKERGVQPRVFDHLFALTTQRKKESTVEYLIKCSYLEIYNEQIMDLLSATQSNLMVREDLKKGVYIEGLTEEIAKNSEETIQLLLRGMRNRHVGATNMNFESSRSHSVFSMTIESKKTHDGMINVKVSKLHFVDLAGSERQKQTAAQGDRLKEASNINKSLTTLGLVINSLVEQAGGRNRHIPYRDSKLTFLLKDSLGGNSRTYMIAAVSAASTSFQETLSTLQFAQRAKMIKNKASINEEAQGNVESLKKEIKRLKEELAQSKNVVVQLEESIKNGGGTIANASGNAGGNPNAMDIESSTNDGTETTMNDETHLSGDSMIKTTKKGMFSEAEAKEMLAINNRCLEVEEDFKRCITQIQSVIEDHIAPEISKKDQYLHMYHTGVQIQDQCETHHKAIMHLFQQRVTRLNLALSAKFDPAQLKETMGENSEMMNEQYEELLKLMSETPNIMNVYDENVHLKQKIEKYQAEQNAASAVSTELIIENITKAIAMSKTFEASIEERRFVRERLEKFNMMRMPVEENIQAIEDSIHTLKIEHNEVVEKLNYDLANLKQKENAQERALDQERNKVLQLKQEILKLKELRAKDLQSHQEEIEELLNQFNNIDDEKNQVTDEYEQNIGQLNRKIIEVEAKFSNQKQQLTEAQAELVQRDEMLAQEQKLKEALEKELNDAVDAFALERCELENKVNALKSKQQLSLEELAQASETIVGLKKRVHQLDVAEETHKTAYDALVKERAEEIRKLEQQLNEKSDQLIHFEQQMEQEDDKLADYEAEKNKIAEELGILTDTYNYQSQDLAEKNILVTAHEAKIKSMEKEMQELNTKIENLLSSGGGSTIVNGSEDTASTAGGSQITLSVSGANSSVTSGGTTSLIGGAGNAAATAAGKKGVVGNENMAAKQYKEMQEQNHQLRLQVEFESNQNITLRSQMNGLSNKVTELQQSEKHFRAAYLEVRNSLQSLSQRNKDLQQALSSKEMEHYEIQRDMKSANENVQFLQERIVGVKNEMKVKERESMESENRLKKCKETVIKLQENLRSKMDNLQQALMKNGELETKMAVLLREQAQIKTELKSKSSLSEKRVQELLQSFAQQRTEMTQMQKIINSKIEENISLTANNRLLQNLIEKYTTNEWEAKQSQKGQQDKFVRDEQNYKKRIDHLIVEYGKMEQESVCNSEVEQLQDLKTLLESKMKESENLSKNKEYQIKSLVKEKDILLKENERLDKQVYDFKQQQQYIMKEKDSIITQLQSSVLEKEKELKEVHNKISQIQIGIQQAQQYFNKYQMVQEENKKLKQELELRDHSVKNLENQINQIRLNPNMSQSQLQQLTKSDDALKYKEKFIILDEKYQGLKKKYLLQQQQHTTLLQQLNEAQAQVLGLQQQLATATTQQSNSQNIANAAQTEALHAEIKNLGQLAERLREDNKKHVNQIAKITSSGNNDIPKELSGRIHQLCEFVLQQLEQTSKDLLNNIPLINGSIEQSMMFMVHAFNNLFEEIKTKEGTINAMSANEKNISKKVSSLEKEILILKKRLSNNSGSSSSAQMQQQQQSFPTQEHRSSSSSSSMNTQQLPTPKASVVNNSVYKTPSANIGVSSSIGGGSSSSTAATPSGISFTNLNGGGGSSSSSSSNNHYHHESSSRSNNNGGTSSVVNSSYSYKNSVNTKQSQHAQMSQYSGREQPNSESVNNGDQIKKKLKQ